MIRTVWKLAAAAVLAGGAAATPAPASTVTVHTAEQVLANSDAVLQGRVVAVSCRWAAAQGGAVLTDCTIAVDEVLADETKLIAERLRPDGTIVLTFVGGTIGDLNHTVHGVPTFAVGDRAFWMLRRRDIDSTSPITGVWQGLYRVVPDGTGRQVVYGPGGCCSAASLHTRHFFAKVRTAAAGFEAGEFAAELRRALPLAKAEPGLRFETLRARVGALPAGAFDHTMIETAEAGPAVGADAARIMPDAMPGAPARPLVDAPTSIDWLGGASELRPPIRERWGYFRAPPDLTWAFNVAPSMGDFAQPFRLSMSYWNLKVSDILFRLYENNTNTTSFGNDRNEAVFLADGGLSNVQGRTWNGSELALCSSLSRGNEIKESDIYFNSNPNVVWTNDRFTAHVDATASPNNSATFFPMVALHELGHSFGLDHQWIPDPGATFPSVMNYFAGNLGYQAGAIFANDTSGIRGGYPGSYPGVDAGIWMMYQSGGRNADANRSNATDTAIPANTSVQRGTNLAVGTGTAFFTVDNAGTGSFQPRVDFFLCPIFGSFESAIYCGSSTLPSFPEGASGRFQRNVPIPANTVPGAYYLGAILEIAGDEHYYGNNEAWNHWPVTVTAAQPPNDGSALATAIDARVSTSIGTTVGATASGFGACGSSAASPDVWYVFTAPHTGTLKLDTCGTGFDTVLELFQSSPSGAGIACDDDDDLNRGPCNTASSRTSYILRNVTVGFRYWVRVSGFNGAAGDFTLNARLIPANDTCDRPRPGFPGISDVTATLPSAGGSSAGTTIGAGSSFAGSLPACTGYRTNGDPINIEHLADVWYAWTAPCTGFARAGVETDEAFAPQIAAYDRCVLSTFSQPIMVGCGQLFGPGQASVGFNAVAGEIYHLRVWTANAAGADFRVSINHFCAPPNDEPSGVDVPGGDGRIAVGPDGAVDKSLSTLSATGTAGLPIPQGCSGLGEFDPGPDLWFALDIGMTGRLDVTRCDGDYLPVVALYSAPPGPGDSPAACGYDPSGSCDPVILSRDVIAGESFLVRVAGNPNGPGEISGSTTLSFVITPPTAVGACCAADGGCVPTAPLDCAGSYQGDDTACDPTPCPQPSGACCTGSSCSQATGADCAAAGGSYLGDNSSCIDEPGNPTTCCPANTDSLGGVDVADIFTFLSLWFTQDPAADTDGSGSVDVTDIFGFLSAWFVGC